MSCIFSSGLALESESWYCLESIESAIRLFLKLREPHRIVPTVCRKMIIPAFTDVNPSPRPASAASHQWQPIGNIAPLVAGRGGGAYKIHTY